MGKILYSTNWNGFVTEGKRQMKGSPSDTGLEWSSVQSHSTTCNLIPMIHPTGGKEYPCFIHMVGGPVSSNGVLSRVVGSTGTQFHQTGGRGTHVSSKRVGRYPKSRGLLPCMCTNSEVREVWRFREVWRMTQVLSSVYRMVEPIICVGKIVGKKVSCNIDFHWCIEVTYECFVWHLSRLKSQSWLKTTWITNSLYLLFN